MPNSSEEIETEKQVFLMELIDISNSYLLSLIPNIKHVLRQAALAGANHMFFQTTGQAINGVPATGQVLKQLMQHLKEVEEFEVEENPPDNHGYYRVKW